MLLDGDLDLRLRAREGRRVPDDIRERGPKVGRIHEGHRRARCVEHHAVLAGLMHTAAHDVLDEYSDIESPCAAMAGLRRPQASKLDALELEELTSEPAETASPGFTDVLRALRVAGYEVIEAAPLPPGQWRDCALDAIALTLDRDRMLLYLFDQEPDAEAYAASSHIPCRSERSRYARRRTRCTSTSTTRSSSRATIVSDGHRS